MAVFSYTYCALGIEREVHCSTLHVAHSPVGKTALWISTCRKQSCSNRSLYRLQRGSKGSVVKCGWSEARMAS